MRWQDIEIGDFIKTEQDEFFPADMVVVKSTEDEGVCYVETKNLDGETNLKNKGVPKDLWHTFDDAREGIKHFDAQLNIDGPNNLIYKFDGRIEAKQRGEMLLRADSAIGQQGKYDWIIPLSNDNVVLRGMSLRNVEYTIAIVVYTGHETKIQMNTTKSEYKVSKMMHLTNSAIFWIFIMQCLFSLGGAIYCAYWQDANIDNPYLLLNADRK